MQGYAETSLARIKAAHARWRDHFAPLFGREVRRGPGKVLYRLVDCNDLGVLYWARVHGGKATRKTWVLPGRCRDWAEAELQKL